MRQHWGGRSIHRFAALVLAAVCLACGSGPKIEPTQAAALAPVEVPGVTPFGVPECDAYVKKYLACVEGRIPGEQKEGLIEAFEANRTKWRALSAMKEGAMALALSCRVAAQKSKEELTGCGASRPPP